MQFHITFVYGAPEIPRRKTVWQLLTDLYSTREDQPWFLTGDFNEIMDNKNREGKKDQKAPLPSSDHSSQLVTSLISNTVGTFSREGEGDIHTWFTVVWIDTLLIAHGLISSRTVAHTTYNSKVQTIDLSTHLSTLRRRNLQDLSDMIGECKTMRR